MHVLGGWVPTVHPGWYGCIARGSHHAHSFGNHEDVTNAAVGTMMEVRRNIFAEISAGIVEGFIEFVSELQGARFEVSGSMRGGGSS